MVHSFVKETLHILTPTLSLRNTPRLQNGYIKDLKNTILKWCCPPSIVSFTSLKGLWTAVRLFQICRVFLSKRCLHSFITLHSCKSLWTNLYVQEICWMMLFWKQTSKSMLKLVCFFYFQVVGALYTFPWFKATFWEGPQTMRKPAKHLDDVHERWLGRWHQFRFFPRFLALFGND